MEPLIDRKPKGMSRDPLIAMEPKGASPERYRYRLTSKEGALLAVKSKEMP
jgi:hypothetical protein